MKKIILSIAMVAAISFISCSDSDDTPEKNCKTCLDVADTGIDFEICDNGDGTATVKSSLGDKVLSTTTLNIPEGESINTISCEDLASIDVINN